MSYLFPSFGLDGFCAGVGCCGCGTVGGGGVLGLSIIVVKFELEIPFCTPSVNTLFLILLSSFSNVLIDAKYSSVAQFSVIQ